ncbi:MAG: hypothetical protein H6707_04605 [Deltaproteobacteria bacterium]|nr:hypothetical protein [Deltaproteobacteria bacterium]
MFRQPRIRQAQLGLIALTTLLCVARADARPLHRARDIVLRQSLMPRGVHRPSAFSAPLARQLARSRRYREGAPRRLALAVKANVQRAKQRWQASRTYALYRRASDHTERLFLRFGDLLTERADRYEGKLPARLARSFHGLRQFNPLTIVSFALREVKKDPKALLYWALTTRALTYTSIPLTMGVLGWSFGLAYGMSYSYDVLCAIGVLAASEGRRAGGFFKGLAVVRKQFRHFVRERRAAARARNAARDARRAPALQLDEQASAGANMRP